MTKIEAYKQAKSVADKLKRSADYAIGRDDSRNDTHTFNNVKSTGLIHGDFSTMKFEVRCFYGYCGSLIGYGATSDEMGQYLARAIQQHTPLLLDCAVKMAADDAEQARKAAEDEAREVLTETAA